MPSALEVWSTPSSSPVIHSMAIRMFVNDDAAEGGRRLLSVEQRMSNRNRDDIAESLHSPASHFVVAPSYSRDETVMIVPDGVIMKLFHNAAEGDGWTSDQDGDTTIAGALPELSTDYDGDFAFAVEGLQKHALGESVADRPRRRLLGRRELPPATQAR